MTFLSEIHISQIPEIYQGTGTYSNDMSYIFTPDNPDYTDCLFWLTRKIKQLDKKIETGKDNAYLKRWQNQKVMYEAILKYLSLRKQP